MTTPSIFAESLDTVNSLESALPIRRVRRRIDPRSGRALEMLGHAIEYLTDEYLQECAEGVAPLCAGDGRVQAIQVLMAANREIYFQCPEVEDLATRCLSILRRCRHTRKTQQSAAGA